jgi:hypothetical protein
MLIKYPRTFHLPWSEGFTSDDKVLDSVDQFLDKRVIITEKMDGENTTMYSDHIHARSVDSRGGFDRDWVKAFWAERKHLIPPGWRICGENLWAKHSIGYDNLKSYFYGFSIWDQNNYCLDWDLTQYYFSELNIVNPNVFYDGVWDTKTIQNLHKQLDFDKVEGYVVRLHNTFNYDDFNKSVAKYVRKNHVNSESHWRNSTITQNTLESIK